VEVRRSVVIDRAAEVVAAQFADVAHHEATGVHPAATFAVIDEGDGWCEYDQVSRVGPRSIRQRYRLDRTDLRHQVNTVTDGLFTGGTLTFSVAEQGSDRSEVTATLTTPRSRLLTVVGPALSQALGRSLARALAEDKSDLESDRYPAAN
jgi:hypothetical protein